MDSISSLASIVPAIVLELGSDGVVRYANDYLEEVTGFAPSEVVGRHWLTEFVPEQERSRVTDVFEGAVSGTPTRGNVNEVLTRDGGRISVQWNDRVLTDERGVTTGILAVGVDVTAQMQHRRELERYRSLLAEAQRMARIGVWEYEFRTGALWWSDEIAELFGMDPKLATPSYEAFMSVVHPEDRELVVREYRSLLATGRPYRVTHRLVRRDGRAIWVEERVAMDVASDGEPLLVRGTVQDVSERLEHGREIALKDAALENASVPILIGDLDGTVIHVNEAFIDAWRAESVDRVRRSGPDEMWSYHGAGHREHTGMMLRQGRPWRAEVDGNRFDGTVFPAEMRSASIRDETGVVTHVVASFTDLTDRVEADRAKSEFLSMVSHELRTPLTSIDGALRLVNGGVVGPVTDDMRQYLTAALRNTRRLTHLIDQLLISERIAAGRFAVDVGPEALMPIVRGLVEAHHPYGADRAVRVELEGEVPDIVVETDAEPLEQVLTNILSNAIKFSPDGGVVRVSVNVDDLAATIEVADDGPGIPAEYHDTIFDRFTQIDGTDSRAVGGTGLGLSIAKALADQLGVGIGLRSSVGVGTTFSLTVPRTRTGQSSDPEMPA